ncbi:MAG: RhuM family protein [Saprospiraceae bacterium]|nr:virulence protein RhuM/Fic/DOC family protein [Saprospiraceae bacterium]MDW8228237.1 RhuM family protein [Saprospiraceae bacterium]
MSEIIIYQTPDRRTELEVRLEGDTVWLTQAQMSLLFQRERSVITKHIRNVFAEGELDEKSNVQILHIANSDKPVNFYNLDVIISVGYRVKSKRGVQFRQWATQRLKEYLVKGYALNESRLKQLSSNLQQLERAVSLIQATSNIETLQLQEARGLLDILSAYTRSFVLLNQYDNRSLPVEELNTTITYEITYEEAIAAIAELKRSLMAKKEATDLFGREKDNSFRSSLQSVVQTFGGQYLYSSVEEQAAHLLYFVIKNHSFVDGNKRIGAFLFVWFLERNQHRFKKNGEVKINDNGLTALALPVA